MSRRVDAWKAAWESRDVERIVAMYAPDATHASALVRQVLPEADGAACHGRAQIAEYFRRALGRYRELRFELLTVTEDGGRSAVEYRRHSDVDGANPKHVLELLEWRGDLLSAVRVFHA
jgi:nuclear transport factor 2 (NTF2) superfamily protein